MPDTKASADPSVAIANVADADSLLGLFASATGTNGRLSFANLKAYLLAGLAAFTATAKGLVPASGGGTANFLRADGAWAAPPAGGASGVKNNYEATTAPTATDDSASGYAGGSSWLISATGDMWRCRDATAGAARWVKIDAADHPGYVPGRYYVPFGLGAQLSGQGQAAGRMGLMFGVIKQRITISHLGIRLTTAASGGSFQLAVYAHNAATGQPGALLGRTGSGSTTTAILVNAALMANVMLEPGNYWFALMYDTTTAVAVAVGPNSPQHAALLGAVTAAIGQVAGGWPGGLTTAFTTFGTWPADLTGASFSDNAERPAVVQFLVASVP